jgi:hypothetical protein
MVNARNVTSAARRFPHLVAALALFAYVLIHVRGWGAGPIVSDGYSYYVYLPSWLLFHDVTLSSVARLCCGGVFPEFTAIRQWPGTLAWVNPHPIGTAILIAPFFVVAHALTRWSNLSPDGFSFYYQHGAGVAGLCYMVLGLAILGRLLSRHFSAGATLAALITVTWGTNLFHYGTYDPVFSHAYSFFLIAAFLALTDTWWRDPRVATSAVAGAVAGLIVLVRHTNAIFLLVLPLYGVTDGSSLRTRARALADRWPALAGIAALAAIVVLPQLLIYRQAAGRWVFSPYAEVNGFDFGSPHVAGVLFGVRKGLFFWSPALLLAVLGVAVARGWALELRVAAVTIFCVDTFLIASWRDWQFGASFGHRGFTDGFALAAVFLASAFEWIGARPRLKPWAAAATTLLVALSVAQMYQYWIGILPSSNATWQQYQDVFLRFR